MDDAKRHADSAIRQFGVMGVHLEARRPAIEAAFRATAEMCLSRYSEPATKADIEQVNRRLDAIERHLREAPKIFTNAIAGEIARRGVRGLQ